MTEVAVDEGIDQDDCEINEEPDEAEADEEGSSSDEDAEEEEARKTPERSGRYSSDISDEWIIDTWSRKFAIGPFPGDPDYPAELMKKKKKKHKKHKKKKDKKRKKKAEEEAAAAKKRGKYKKKGKAFSGCVVKVILTPE